MIRYRRRERTIAICFAFLAGYVDALGFLELGGYFVSFMTGNSTRLGVGLADGVSNALIPAAIIGLFVVGVIAGSLVGHVAKSHRPLLVTGFVAVLLFAAAAFAQLSLSTIAIVFMAIAMGAENAVFERDGEVSIGLTYMTGTLVKLGQRITAALLGGSRLAWLWYLLLWMGLAAGAVAGTLVYREIGLRGLWAAAGIATALCLAVAFFIERDGQSKAA